MIPLQIYLVYKFSYYKFKLISSEVLLVRDKMEGGPVWLMKQNETKGTIFFFKIFSDSSFNDSSFSLA